MKKKLDPFYLPPVLRQDENFVSRIHEYLFQNIIGVLVILYVQRMLFDWYVYLQHGADGIDDKPVPQDLWGLRGALQGVRGMPHVPERIDSQTARQRGISNDPFPGLNRDGKVERSVFRKQVEAWCPTHRFQERSIEN